MSLANADVNERAEQNPENRMLSILEKDVVRGMSPKAAARMKAIARIETYEPGQAVHEYGEPVSSVFVLQEGAVEIVMPGTQRVLSTMREVGSLLGWSSMVDRETASATIRCPESTTLIRFERSDLEDVFRKHPKSGLLFYKKLAGEIGERLTTSYRIVSLLLGEIA